MKNPNFLAIFVVAVFALCSCNSCSKSDEPVNKPENENPVDSVPSQVPVDSVPSQEPVVTTAFVKGADLGWVTEMEADGVTFYDADGKEYLDFCAGIFNICVIS